MKKLPFIYPLLGFGSGILLAELIQSSAAKEIFFAISIGLFCLSIGLSVYKKIYVLTFNLMFIIFGWIYSEQFNQLPQLNKSLLNTEQYVQLKIKESFRSSEKYKKYEAEILGIGQTQIGKINTLFCIDKHTKPLVNGEIIWIQSEIQSTKKPLNPYQFDYSKYLKRKGIQYSIYTHSILSKEKPVKSIAYFCSNFKQKIHEKLLKSGYSKSSTDIMSAMLLGDRTDMDRSIEDQYRKTGVVHILTISGLHVMMVYSIFYFLLLPISHLKNGKIIRIILSLVLIWAYVVFVGFQAAVLRSALMIAIFQLTIAFQRKPNVYHTLSVTAFLLLLFNPNYLFDAGFQLSFSAVFFIVFFNRILQPYNQSQFKIKKHTFNFVSTSMAAQLGTLPFTIFYFNQTSGLFLFGNIVMIAASYFMIVGGMLSIILNLLGLEFEIWIWIFNAFIEACNHYIAWLSGFEFLIFDSLHFNFWEVILVIIGLILLGYFIQKPKSIKLIGILGILLLFQIQFIINKQNQLTKKETVVFQQYNNSVIGIRESNRLDVYLDDLNDSTNFNKYNLKPYLIHENIQTVNWFNLSELENQTNPFENELSYNLLKRE